MAGELDIGFSFVLRNEFGRFIAACEEAATETVKAAAEEATKAARANAPEGHKHDKRSIPIKLGISYTMISSTQARVVSLARHSAAIEHGSIPHEITGSPDLSFFWEREGRRFVPSSEFYHDPDAVTIVNHPGNDAQPFMRPAYELMRGDIVRIAKEKYPG